MISVKQTTFPINTALCLLTMVFCCAVNAQAGKMQVECTSDQIAERTNRPYVAASVTTTAAMLRSPVYWFWQASAVSLDDTANSFTLGGFGKGLDGSDYVNELAQQRIIDGRLWLRGDRQNLYLQIETDKRYRVGFRGQLNTKYGNEYRAIFRDRFGFELPAKCTLKQL